MGEQYFFGYVNTSNELQESTSGGIAYALCKFVVEQNGAAYGVIWKDNYKSAQYARISNVNALHKIQGTKYIRASLKMADGRTVYDWVMDDLKLEKLVIFIGLPCEVAGLRKRIDSPIDKNLLCVDLICHGPVKRSVLESFVKKLEKKYRSNLNYFNLRYKNPDWGNAYVKGVFENGKVFLEELHKTEFGIAFNIMGESGCYDCRFRGNNHKSDLTIGDYWGAEPEDVGYNPKGLSLIIFHNNKLNDFVKDLDISIYEILDSQKALKGNPYYGNPRVPDPRREKFIRLYNKFGLTTACVFTIGIKSVIHIYFPILYKLLKKIKRSKQIKADV